MAELRQRQMEGKLDPVTALQTALGSKKLAVDTAWRRMKIRHAESEILTVDDARHAARQFVMELGDIIRRVATRYKLDGEAFLQEVLAEYEQLEQTIIERGTKPNDEDMHET